MDPNVEKEIITGKVASRYAFIKKIALLAAISAVLPNSVLAAAPSITLTSEQTVVHGQSLKLTGFGFGVKSPVAPMMWDPIDGQAAYSKLTDGSIIPVGVGKPWALTELNKPVYFKTSNPRGKWSAKYSNQWSIAGDGKAAIGGKNFPAAAGKNLFVSWWMYPKNDMTIGGTNSSNKFCRFTPTGGWDVADFIWEPRIFYWNNLPSGYKYLQYKNWNGNIGAWNRMDVNIDNSVNPKPRVSGYINNQLFISGVSGDGTGTAGGAVTGALNADITGIYVIGFDASNSDGKQPVVDFGEIYVDNTIARVEIGDAPIFSASTHREIQIPQNVWNDDQIEIKVNQGSFSDNTQAYLFVIDAAGNASPGKAITFDNPAARLKVINPQVEKAVQ